MRSLGLRQPVVIRRRVAWWDADGREAMAVGCVYARRCISRVGTGPPRRCRPNKSSKLRWYAGALSCGRV